jgi:RNA polymerase sigma-70 factor (ECF subfamily)
VANELSDELLMERYQRGDKRAFEILAARHQGPVFNFILRFLGHREAAEDVLQEVFLRIVRGAGQFQRRAKFTTWLYTIARNLCIDTQRKAHYRRADSLDSSADDDPDSPTLGSTVAGTERSGEEATFDSRVREAVVAALEALSPEQREVFVLREYAGLPFQEIAGIVGCPENTVKSRMRYALENLRKSLSGAGITSGSGD